MTREGTGKTVTAVSDAKKLGKRTLFVAHTKELITQAKDTFDDIWAEAHHGTASTYKRLLNYFEPKFTLGLTATPDRADGEDLLEIFQKEAHKLDLETAVKLGELASVRCIRVKTNVDLSDVRINGIRYNSRDLESKLFVAEINNIILNTYLQFVRDKKTVIFCASVDHAEEIAKLFRTNNINCEAVSGRTKDRDRNRILDDYENGSINVLCACDLLNEGWDSPNTEVLFMARPTMSKTIYMQQLGRGMRLAPDKEYLMVFDFIDNSNLFNTPYSLHRMFNIGEYRPGEYVLASDKKRILDKDLISKGEKPSVYLDFPMDVMDYEIIDLFDWQEEVKNMISQMEFVRMVDVQSETIARYIREKKIHADLVIPMGNHKKFNFFKNDTILNYVKEFKWQLITPANMKDKFMEMVDKMDMSYSYKPVLLKAIFENIDDKRRVRVEDLVDYFIDYYEARREKGLVVEKRPCLYLRDYTRKEVERNIFSNPFKRFEDMNFMKRNKDLEFIEINRHIMKNLSKYEIELIMAYSDKKLNEYFND